MQTMIGNVRKGLSLVVAAAAFAAGAATIDGVAAKVGSAVILKSDVLGEMRRADVRQDKYAEVRDSMIERELILAAAERAKLQMQEWVVDNRIRDIVKQAFGGDRNKLMEALAKERVSFPEWRRRMKDDMLVAAMRWQIIDKNVVASPSDMRKEYADHPERYIAERRVTVSAIMLPPDSAGKRAEIDAALKKKPFADLAREYSADPSAKDAGRWKDVRPEDVFRPEICAEIAKMPKGTISQWIELDGWSFRLRKDAETGGGRQSFEDAYEAVEGNVKKEVSKRLYKEWVERLKAEAYVKVYDDK